MKTALPSFGPAVNYAKELVSSVGVVESWPHILYWIKNKTKTLWHTNDDNIVKKLIKTKKLWYG